MRCRCEPLVLAECPPDLFLIDTPPAQFKETPAGKPAEVLRLRLLLFPAGRACENALAGAGATLRRKSVSQNQFARSRRCTGCRIKPETA